MYLFLFREHLSWSKYLLREESCEEERIYSVLLYTQRTASMQEYCISKSKGLNPNAMGGICRKLYHPSLKTYFVLVLVPQILWMFSSPNGFTAVCESCCNSNYQELLLMQPPATSGLAPARADCKPTTDSLQPDRDCVDSSHVEQSVDQKSASMQADMYGDVNVSSLCTCNIDQPSNERLYSDSKETRDLSRSEMDGGW